MKKYFALFLVMALLCSGFANAQYWDNSNNKLIACCEDRPGCQVLQTVMMGSFAQLDTQDHLSVRIFSAALLHLTSVTEDDLAHFSKNFDLDPVLLQELYYTALGNCLRADMIINPAVENPNEQNARTVLALFLDPSSAANAQEQILAIRSTAGSEDIRLIAESAGVPYGFTAYLMQ